MKSIFLSVLLVFSFLNFANAKDSKTDVPYLAHEDFVDLYEADQREYIILLRQAAADLSYEDQLSVFQKLNIKEPFWVSLLTTEARSEVVLSDRELISEIRAAAAAAKALNDRPPITINQAVYRETDPSFDDDKQRQDEILIADRKAVLKVFETRDRLVAAISRRSVPSQRILRDELYRTNQAFTKLYNDSMGRARNPPFKERMRDLDRLYDTLFTTPLGVAPGESVTGLDLSQPPNLPAGVQCVRCIYGGFVITNDKKCKAVSSHEEMKSQLPNLNLPPGTEMNCESPKSVMCSPLVFGLKRNASRQFGALCVPPSASATRSCTAVSGTGADSIITTREMIVNNPLAYRQFVSKIRNICTSARTRLCNTPTRSQDIDSTCAVITERMRTFSDKMRLYPRRPSPRSPSRPGAAPVGTGA